MIADLTDQKLAGDDPGDLVLAGRHHRGHSRFDVLSTTVNLLGSRA